MEQGMTDNELKQITIKQYSDLQRIKRSFGEVTSDELEYQIRIVTAQLNAMGISTDDLIL